MGISKAPNQFFLERCKITFFSSNLFSSLYHTLAHLQCFILYLMLMNEWAGVGMFKIIHVRSFYYLKAYAVKVSAILFLNKSLARRKSA